MAVLAPDICAAGHSKSIVFTTLFKKAPRGFGAMEERRSGLDG
jgi:hypothetical protein